MTITTGRERTPLDPELLARAAEDIGKWNTYLTSIPVGDTAQWARAAGRTAGVFAAWSARTEPTPGPLAIAATALSQSAQIPAHQRIAPDPKRRHEGGAALIVVQTALATRGGAAANALLLRQMMWTMEAFADSERAAGNAQQAHALVRVRERELTTLHTQLVHTSVVDRSAVVPAPDSAPQAVSARDDGRPGGVSAEAWEAARLTDLGNAGGSPHRDGPGHAPTASPGEMADRTDKGARGAGEGQER